MRWIIYCVLYVLIICYLYVPFTAYEDISISAYFCQETNCKDLLLDLLQQDQQAVCAFYDINEPTLISYLLVSPQEILTHQKTNEHPNRFLSYKRPGLMHHKYCVLNDEYVYTGSWNPTTLGTYENDNYMLLIHSKKLAKRFLQEQQYLKGKQSPKPLHLRSQNTTIDLYFCPQHNCEEQVQQELQTTTSSIELLAFTFTSEPLAQTLQQLIQQNITLTAVFETRQSYLSSIEEDLTASGANIYFDGNPRTMHGKVWILDNQTLILGSYNPTKAATTKNDETLIIIRNNSQLVEAFQNEFRRVLALAKPCCF